MRALRRNKRLFYYCLYAGKTPIIDEWGNETGESIVTYSDPVEMLANISPATGLSNTEQFGNLENYDKVIVTDWIDCQIDENSVLFIDKEPEFTEGETHEPTAVTTTDVSVRIPVPDYIVVRVAKSLNSVSIAVRKVKVS